jgi:short-subunit dehydrogenase involved in D-alanine esterification of teichoic acids
VPAEDLAGTAAAVPLQTAVAAATVITTARHAVALRRVTAAVPSTVGRVCAVMERANMVRFLHGR